jgi:pantoate--beta-alanine ligase
MDGNKGETIMKVIRTIDDMRKAIRQYRLEHPHQLVGFVPTMGYLHDGHASLIRRAREECGFVVISIFVNPLQFGPNEDYEKYPRDEQRDIELAERHGADVVFMPAVSEMYPSKPLTKVSVDRITNTLCGVSRPGHFDGVCTVVSKLFHIVQPDRAYFGMKDAQQVAVITRMTEDLNIPVEIVPCPIVREADGLALSSRNVYLSPEEREQALVLNRSLRLAEQHVREHPDAAVGEIKELIRRTIHASPLAAIDYVELVGYPSLEPLDEAEAFSAALGTTDILAALAVKFGHTRLIDNHLWTREGGDN